MWYIILLSIFGIAAAIMASAAIHAKTVLFRIINLVIAIMLIVFFALVLIKIIENRHPQYKPPYDTNK